MAEARTAHPYHVYDAVVAQPDLIESLLARAAAIEAVADAAAAKSRLLFVGIGTSLHAGRISELWTREFTSGRFRAQFEQSFEFLHHPFALDSQDAVIVFTHTGTSGASVEAIHRAKAAGALTIAIVGENCGERARAADFLIETCGQEAAFAYTKSYTTALAASAALLLRFADRKGFLPEASGRAALGRVPDLMRQSLALEPEIRSIARKVASLPRVEIFGAGPGWATAREGALKIKESCYIAAEGFDTEEILHGPFSELDSRGALIGMLTGKPSDERARQIFRAAGELKTLRIAITVPSARHDISAEHILVVPESDEWLSAFVHLVPLQLLNYFIALEKGVNPDTGRQDQPAHAAASRHYKY
ncbi:MAG TPA: SIS domain-containing protein [Verrucomicrobiae bacterium]|nr:SIS domain-containing protein [Verrucomicrobiae bacterium]